MSVKITCDACEADLTEARDGMPRRRLALWSEAVSIPNGVPHKLLAVTSELQGTHYFCSLSCLRTWMDRRPTTTQRYMVPQLPPEIQKDS